MNSFTQLESADIRFVGDTHFRDIRAPGEAARRERFLSFLEGLPAPSTLFLMGDIFDFYFEYQSVVSSRHLDILEGLRACSRRGVDLHFIGGNHDYWVGESFSRLVGTQVHEVEICFVAQGRRIVVSHGDLVMPRDYGYKLLKGVLRNRAVIALTRLIHPDLLDWIARGVSDGSRRYKRHSQEPRARAVTEWAHKQFFDRGNDAYVMGHVHYATHDVRDGREFVIVGDWYEGSSYARLHNGQLSLVTTPTDSAQG